MFSDKATKSGAIAAWRSNVAKLADELASSSGQLAWLVRCAVADAIVAELPATAVAYDEWDGIT